MKHKKTLKKILFVLLVLIAYGFITFLLFYTENGKEGSNINSMGDAFWYSIVTLTTVGYGDFYPVSLAGRMVALVFIIGSVGVIGYFISQITAQVTSFLERRKLGYMGTNFENHILIIGWDKFAQQVADEVIHTGKQVGIITNDKNTIDLIHELYSTKNVYALFTDYSNLEAFEKANITQAASVFINFPNDTEILIYVLNLREKYPKLNYVVSLNNPSLRETFASAGVRYVVSKNEMASRLVASYTFEPDVAEMAESLMTTALEGKDYDMQEYYIKPENPFAGKDYLEAFVDLKIKHDCVLMGISKTSGMGRQLLKNPGKGVTIEASDYLIIMCDGLAKKKIEKLFKVTEGRLVD
jgi:voltage-gated potassium channel